MFAHGIQFSIDLDHSHSLPPAVMGIGGYENLRRMRIDVDPDLDPLSPTFPLLSPPPSRRPHPHLVHGCRGLQEAQGGHSEPHILA